MTNKKLLVYLLLILNLTGCAHKVQTVNREISGQTGLSFLKDGETTKAEVFSKLGTRCVQFEGGRIVAYRLNSKYRVITPTYSTYDSGLWDWEIGNYSLVLVFDVLDAKRLCREMEALEQEKTAQLNRINALLIREGVPFRNPNSRLLGELGSANMWKEKELPADVQTQIVLESERLRVVEDQIYALKMERARATTLQRHSLVRIR